MTHLPRRLRILNGIARAATILAGTVTGAYAVIALLDQGWTAALPYVAATVWAFLYAAHSCPTPVPDPVDRGEPCLHLIGGPEDGGQYAIEGLTRDMAGARLMVDGTPYTVTSIRSTCYTAEVER